jgi:hypothetical protein
MSGIALQVGNIFQNAGDRRESEKQNVTVLATQWQRCALLMRFQLLLKRPMDFSFNRKPGTF